MAAVAEWCIRHARLVIVGWCAAGVGLLLAGGLVGSHYRTEFRLPGTDSQRAADLIRADFPDLRGDTEQLALRDLRGRFGAADRHLAEQLFARIRAVPDVIGVADPFTGGGSGLVSADRRTAIALVRFPQLADDVPVRSVRRVMSLVAAAGGRTFAVGLAGPAVEDAMATTPAVSAAVAGVMAVVVLLVGFGSAAAVGLALISALLALGVGFGALSLASHLLQIPSYATQVATAVGFGVGIDYALLVLARYRGGVQVGLAPRAATVAAMRTAGRAVAFAGGTVLLALLGLFLVDLPFIHGLAVGVILVVAPTMLTATTVLPALLGRAGHQLERWRPPGLRGRQLGGRSPGWARWARRVQRRPVTAVALALTALGLLAVPMLSLRLGSAEASTDNTATLSHRGYTLAAQAFGPGFTDPFQVVLTLPRSRSTGASATGALSVAETVLRRTPDVAAVSAPQLDRTGQTALLTVYPASGPTASRTGALVGELRAPVRARLARYGVQIAVGGQAAVGLDLAATVGRAVPFVLAAVIGTSLVLLLVLFRSIVVAVKAGLMNLLAIAAAFGVVVAVFQWGWGLHLIGVDYPGPIESFLPLLLFPVVFGLSMDYEVFLVTRIRDEWDRTGNNTTAVTEGLASTGRVVTAGAAIMIVVFGSLVFAEARTVKLFGLGLGCAILLDALVVRSVLLPATMQLLGRVNWWLPRWLNRRLPRISADLPALATVGPKSPGR